MHNFVGALLFSVIGYFYVRNRGRGRFARRFIPVANEHTPAADLLQPPAAAEDDAPQ